MLPDYLLARGRVDAERLHVPLLVHDHVAVLPDDARKPRDHVVRLPADPRHLVFVDLECSLDQVPGHSRDSYISRRPERARPSVTSSAYSRSPPTGRPLASRVTRTRPRRRSARYAAVASPVMFGFVASTTSWTPFRSTRRSSSSMRRCSGSTPSSGESAPPSTW